MKVTDTYSLDKEIKDWVEKEAKRQKRSKSFIVNEALLTIKINSEALDFLRHANRGAVGALPAKD